MRSPPLSGSFSAEGARPGPEGTRLGERRGAWDHEHGIARPCAMCDAPTQRSIKGQYPWEIVRPSFKISEGIFLV